MSIIFKQFQDSREDQGNNQQDIFQNIAFYQYRGVFALLRLISHTLQGETPLRSLIKIKAPVPTPPSILSKRLQEEEETDQNQEPQQPLDIDGFTQFLLTGERPSSNKRSKKSKSVKFSDEVDVHDASLISPAQSLY